MWAEGPKSELTNIRIGGAKENASSERYWKLIPAAYSRPWNMVAKLILVECTAAIDDPRGGGTNFHCARREAILRDSILSARPAG
jgi:hypothetical protein